MGTGRVGSKLSIQLSFQIYSLLAQTEGGKKGLFCKSTKRGTTLQDYDLVDIRHKKVSSFVKFEIILPLLCFLLDPFTNKHCDKLVDRFQDLSKVKNPAGQ